MRRQEILIALKDLKRSLPIEQPIFYLLYPSSLIEERMMADLLSEDAIKTKVKKPTSKK